MAGTLDNLREGEREGRRKFSLKWFLRAGGPPIWFLRAGGPPKWECRRAGQNTCRKVGKKAILHGASDSLARARLGGSWDSNCGGGCRRQRSLTRTSNYTSTSAKDASPKPNTCRPLVLHLAFSISPRQEQSHASVSVECDQSRNERRHRLGHLVVARFTCRIRVRHVDEVGGKRPAGARLHGAKSSPVRLCHMPVARVRARAHAAVS